MKKLFFFISFISTFNTLNSFCFAQNKNIDSLQTLIKKDNSDTIKVNHLNNLCKEYMSVGLFDTAIQCSKKALQLSEQLLERNENPKALGAIKKSVANSYDNIGLVYYYQGSYSKTLEYWLKALRINEELQNKAGTATYLGNIGSVYQNQADYPQALDYYFKALKLDEELGNKKGISRHLGNIGIVYLNQEDFPKAMEYYIKALKMAEELGDKNGIARHLGNIGTIYLNQADYSKALDYYFKALKTYEKIGDKNGIANWLGSIGAVYFQKKDFPKALDYYFRALKMGEEFGNKNLIASILGRIGSVYTTTGKFKESERYLKRAIALNESIGLVNNYLMDAELYLSQLYDTTGQQKLALIHLKKATAIKDTLFSQENKKQLVRKEMNYEFEKKEAITKAENEKQQAIAEEKNRKQKIITWSVACGLLLVLLFASFIFRSLRITRKQKQIIEIKNTETELQKKIIEEKNKDITDSIRYAKRIQDALLKEEEHISMHLPEHFILFMPKDIVSGDFYWGIEKPGYWYFAAVDCTGHGVPGAVMSMLGISFLNDIVSSEELLSPAEILNRLRDKVVKELRQKGEAGGSKDGMDISLCRLELPASAPASLELEWGVKAEVEVNLQWAGANNSLNLIRNGKLEEVKPDKQPIGYHPEQHPFTNHEMQLQKGDSIYIYSDGYADQFGGSNGKKFKYKQLEDLLFSNSPLPMKAQKEILKKRFIEWKGSLEQVDDVCVFGVMI